MKLTFCYLTHERMLKPLMPIASIKAARQWWLDNAIHLQSQMLGFAVRNATGATIYTGTHITDPLL